MTQPEALRLAAVPIFDRSITWQSQATIELRRLHADAEESEALRERLSELLRNTAIALRGPEPELTRWSWHDLPELATALKAQRDALLEACRAMLTFIERHAPRGLQPEPGSPVAMARAAIKAAEGENHAKNL